MPEERRCSRKSRLLWDSCTNTRWHPTTSPTSFVGLAYPTSAPTRLQLNGAVFNGSHWPRGATGSRQLAARRRCCLMDNVTWLSCSLHLTQRQYSSETRQRPRSYHDAQKSRLTFRLYRRLNGRSEVSHSVFVYLTYAPLPLQQRTCLTEYVASSHHEEKKTSAKQRRFHLVHGQRN